MYLTAKKTQIKSVSKQSKFEGSDREVRGRIIKQLVNSSCDGLFQQIPLTLNQIKSEFPKKNVEKIVQGLIDEGIVKMHNREVSIVN
ncbi:MAG: hypothetical protein LBG59_01270 [Candidatus Peribacteria bacterium]|nr:hypothetical protein [Candidatus Peribacteria bacterium]